MKDIRKVYQLVGRCDGHGGDVSSLGMCDGCQEDCQSSVRCEKY